MKAYFYCVVFHYCLKAEIIFNLLSLKAKCHPGLVSLSVYLCLSITVSPYKIWENLANSLNMFVDLAHVCASYISVVDFIFSEKTQNIFRFEDESQMLSCFLEFGWFSSLWWADSLLEGREVQQQESRRTGVCTESQM